MFNNMGGRVVGEGGGEGVGGGGGWGVWVEVGVLSC